MLRNPGKDPYVIAFGYTQLLSHAVTKLAQGREHQFIFLANETTF